MLASRTPTCSSRSLLGGACGAGDTRSIVRGPVVFVACLLLTFGAPARADEPTAPLAGEALRAQVQRWIQDLHSGEFAVRESARDALRAHAREALDLLEAAQEDPDAEVRRTVRALLSHFVVGAGEASSAPVPAGRLDLLGLLDLRLDDATLEAAFSTLGHLLGGRFDVPVAAREQRVSLEAVAEPAFQVLDRLLVLGNLRLGQPFDRSQVAKLEPAGDGPRAPRAAAGPLQVEVVSVTSTRSLDSSALPHYALELRVQWIPLVQVSQYQGPRVEVARDAAGHAFRTSRSSANAVTHGVSMNATHANVTLHIEPTGVECEESLAVLELVLPAVRMQHGPQHVSLDDTDRIPVCLGRDGTEVAPGTEGSVNFESLAQAEDARGPWVLDLSATLRADVAQRSVQALLLLPGERVEPLHVAGGRSRSSDGTIRLTARAHRSPIERPRALRVTWFQREEVGDLRLRIPDVPLR